MVSLLGRGSKGGKDIHFRRFDQVGLKKAESTMNEISMAEFQEFMNRDKRIKDLASVMSWPTWDLILNKRLTIVHDTYTNNLYVGCVAFRRKLEGAARKYSNKQVKDGELAFITGYIPEGKISPGPSTNVCFVKEFSDSVVQFITFGQWWERGGYSRAMFGHIVKKDERPYAAHLL